MKHFNSFAWGLLVVPAVTSEVYATRVLVIQPPPSQPHQERPQHPSPPQVMSKSEAIATSFVEEACARDVDYLCSENSFGFPSHMMRMQDPMLNWILQPSAPLPIMDTTPLDQMINDMMNSILSMPPPPPPPPPLTLISSPGQSLDHVVQPHKVVDDIFQSMITSLADHVAESSASADEAETDEAVPEEKETPPTEAIDSSSSSPQAFDPVQFTKQLAEHGYQILEKEENEDKRRLARRLTEVEPDMFRQSSSFGHLPFGCHKNKCLLSALEHGKTSPKCTAALQKKQHFMVTRKVKAEQLKKEQDAFVALVYIYGLLVIGTIILIARRFRSSHLAKKRGLQRRILQLVYNRPELKSQIEGGLGETLGSVPPFHPIVLAGMGAGARERIENWKNCRVARFFTWLGLVALAFVNPFLAMLLLLCLMGAQFFKLLCCPRKLKEDCTCCYCGLSTADAKMGMRTECDCCNGTGVCAPSCEFCCDDEEDQVKGDEECTDEYHQCEEDGTIPPPPSTRRRGTTVKMASEHAYMGIPVQVV